MMPITRETYRSLCHYIDLSCSDRALDLEAAILNFAPVYASVLNTTLTSMTMQPWFCVLESYQQDYCIAYAHFRHSAWVLQHILGGNVELIYSDGADEADEEAGGQEDGTPST